MVLSRASESSLRDGIGGRYANLVVVSPQVAIIGAGRGAQRVLAHRGAPVVCRSRSPSITGW